MSLPPITFATDTELRDQAFAGRLARRRRLLLRWSIPVVVIAVLLAVKFLSAVGLNLIGTAAYERSNFSTAAARYVNTQFVNIVQPWKAHYNEGTAHYSAGKFFTATTQFEIALDKVPKTPEGEPRGPEECMVRVNYSLALEGTAAETLAVGDAQMAEHYYTRALEMLDDCASSGAGGDTAEEAEERQEEGQQESRDQQESQGRDPEEGEPQDPQEGDPGEQGEQDGDGQEGPEEPDPQQQELEERNQRANELDEDQEGGAGVGDGSGQNW